MVSQNETTKQPRERLFFVDFARMLSMVAIAHFHLHEATFFENYMEHQKHGFIELPLVSYSQFMAFSGFSIVFLSYFLIGFIGLSWQKLKKLLIIAALGTALLFIIYFEDNEMVYEWDIYSFIAIASLILAALAKFPRILYPLSFLGAVAIALPQKTWVFPGLQEHWFYGPVFGNYHLLGGGSWPLIPWLGLPLIAFSLGRWLRFHPEHHKRLKTLAPLELCVWAVALLGTSPFWGAYYSVPIGPDFYKFVQSVPILPWLAHMLFVFFALRLGFVSRINQWAARTPWVSWVSKIYLNKSFFFFYMVNWFLIGLFANFADFYVAHWPVFDLVVFGLFPLTEFVCHSLIKGFKEIRPLLRGRLRGAP